MLRPFVNPSDEIVYTANQAEFQFPIVPQGSARSCIVGFTFEPVELGRSDKTLTRLVRFSVGGRYYFSGAPVPLALFDGLTLRQNDAENGAQYFTRGAFTGDAIPLPFGCGAKSAAIPYRPGEAVRVTLERDDLSNGVRRMILHCLQFPDDRADPMNNLYDDLNRGKGEASFVGHALTWPAAGSAVQLEAIPQPPSGQVVRRTEARAIVIDSADGTIQEFGLPAATTLNNVLAELSTSFERAPQAAPTSARSVLGLPGWQPWGIGTVDLRLQERSRVNVTFAGTALPDPTVSLYLLQMFQGRPMNQAKLLGAANAVS
jgi:hypothetical protein